MTTQSAEATGLPLFYREPAALSSHIHADWRLLEGDVSFAGQAPFVPIVTGELEASARHYPVVFAATDAQPIAVLGLERRNLFVEGGLWAPDTYVPAYVRRYPFGFIATVNPDGFALAIDAASGRVTPGGEAGVALFDAGEPSVLTGQALAFCDAFQVEAAATREFAQALVDQDLLIDRRADATLPDGRKLGLDGFRIIDAEKFAALADDIVLEWHRKGWLALSHFHLASIDRFADLLARQEKLGTIMATSQEDALAPSINSNGKD